MVLDDPISPSDDSKSAALNLEQISLATPLDRLAAFIFDTLIFLPLARLLLAPVAREWDISQLVGEKGSFFVSVMIYFALFSVVMVLYQTLFVWLVSGTPGKLFFGLRVRCLWNHRHPTFIQSLLRALGWWIESLLFLIPHLSILSDHKRRPLHDKIADTIVLAPKQSHSSHPSIFESTLVHIFFFGLFSLLVGIVSGYSYHEALLLQQSSYDLSEGEEALACPLIEEAVEESKRESSHPLSRLEIAMALFSVGHTDERCLTFEANNALKEASHEDMAYLALAFASTDDEDLYHKYLKKPCELKKDSESCMISRLLSYWAQEQLDHVSQELDEILPQTHLYLKIWAARHFVKIRDYDRALSTLQYLPNFSWLKSYIGQYRLKALWGLHRQEQAEIAAEITLENLPPDSQIDVASWFCNQQLNLKCELSTSRSCKKFEDLMNENQILLFEPSFALTWIRFNECTRGPTINYEELQQKMVLPEAKTLLASLELASKNQMKEAKLKLQELLIKEQGLGGEFSKEAKIRLARWAERSEELTPLLAEWTSGINHYKSSLQLGNVLLEKYLQFGKKAEAFNLVLHLRELDPYSVEIQKKLVVLAYQTGNSHLALSALNALTNRTQPDRSPSSVDPVESEYKEAVKRLNGMHR